MLSVLVVLISAISILASTEPECGERFESRIFNGIEALPLDFEWNAIVLKKNDTDLDLKCGGALISTQHILTSARCASKINSTEGWFVRLGEHDLTKDPDCLDFSGNHECSTYKDYAIDKVTAHQNFKFGKSFIDNDIAIIKLSQIVNITDGVKTVCLPYPNEKMDSDRHIIRNYISGWQIEGTGTHKNIKNQDIAKLISNEECQKIFSNRVKITENHICIKNLERDPKYSFCSTDVGGPLVTWNKHFRYALSGVMSFSGIGCQYPSVFTKVENYLDWIKSNM